MADGSPAPEVTTPPPEVRTRCGACRQLVDGGRWTLGRRVWACRPCANEIDAYVEQQRPTVVKRPAQCPDCDARLNPDVYSLHAIVYAATALNVVVTYKPAFDAVRHAAEESLISSRLSSDPEESLYHAENGLRYVAQIRARDHIDEARRLLIEPDCDARAVWRELHRAMRLLRRGRDRCELRPLARSMAAEQVSARACRRRRVTLGPCWGFCEDGSRKPSRAA